MFPPLSAARGPRPLPVGASLAVHAGVLASALWGPAIEAEMPRSVYQQLVAPHAKKLVWYRFSTRLPEVSPLERRGPSRPPQAEVIHPAQHIVSRPPVAVKSRQLLLSPAPRLQVNQDLRSPNWMAVEAPRLPEAPKVPPKQFVPPAAPAKRSADIQLAAAPEIAPAAADQPKFAEPKLPARPFSAPPARETAKALLPQAEAPDLRGAGLSAAVIGLNPAELAQPVVPEASQSARLAAGPEKRADGGGGEPVETARIFTPDLMIRGGGGRASLARETRPLPSRLLPRAETVLPPPIRAKAPGLRVTAPPDPRFEGRVVYAMAVQMANVTSHSGSWMIWFAEREKWSREENLTAPAPLRKVDPIYSPAAAAERVEGSVRLAAVIRNDGRVDSILLLKSVDERLDRNAVAALAKWLFEPARRDGSAVDVDAIVEIPFRLAPLARK